MTETRTSDARDADLDIADDFWSATTLDEFTNDRFIRRLNAHVPAPVTIHPLASSGAMTPLRPVDDRFQRLLGRRRSERVFGTAPLRARDVERLLAATGTGRDGRRVVPSAGGLEAVSTFAIGRSVEGPSARRIVRYDSASHAVGDVASCPSDAELAAAFNLGNDQLPAMFVVFVVHLSVLRAKYGARGDRFALVETGCATQNVGLRIANDRLAGYQLGGARREVDRWLRLDEATARVTGAVACGPRPDR